MWVEIPCSIYRGGTSRAIFFMKDDLPDDPTIRDRILLFIGGGNDTTRVNGLLGQTMQTSKILVMSKSKRDELDVDYLHGQLQLDEPYIDYSMSGANIAFAVGLFAHQNQLSENPTRIRAFNENTNTYMDIILPEKEIIMDDDLLELRFIEPYGEITGTLFPTGDPITTIHVDGRKIKITIIDSGNLSVLIDGGSIGMSGNEVRQEEFLPYLNVLSLIRNEVIRLLKGVKTKTAISFENSGLPKIIIIGVPQDYMSTKSQDITSEDYNIWARDVTFEKIHPSFPATGAVTVGAASMIPGTLANVNMQSRASRNLLRIGHPSGILEVSAEVKYELQHQVRSASIFGTSRLLIKGVTRVPQQLFEK